MNCDQNDRCLGHLSFYPCLQNSPCLSVHGWAGVHSAKNKHEGSKDTETNLRLESPCMHNVCKPTAVSTIAASRRTRDTSVRLIFILSLATFPSNHSSRQIIFFSKTVMYFCAFKIFHKK